MNVLFTNALIIDALDKEPREGSVLIEGQHIRGIGKNIKSGGARVIDLKGLSLVPGLIDCHVHVVASLMNLQANAQLPDAIAILRSVPIMSGMLDRGFTTVRDVGGAPPAIADAVDMDLAVGPRIIPCGKALSRTGGHVDFRPRNDAHDPHRWERNFGSLGRVADGKDQVREACRQELRQGAKFIKIMANGGIASPTDPISWQGYSVEETEVAVGEAADAGTYVAAHLYTPDAIIRAVKCGVRSLEHCNLITPEAAHLAKNSGAIAVPTLVAYEALAEDGPRFGFPPESVAKIEDVRGAGMASLEILQSAGVPMAYGTDLLGEGHSRQNEEFKIRARVLPAKDIFASATTVAADLLGLTGTLGVVREGAMADLLAVRGNPLVDISPLADPYKDIVMVMKSGRIHRGSLWSNT